ncbi:hypothetical protein K439DRAFT_652841 [Ramaria rubella]|nr:hypothetical protein K439DRAFT_652841 [Ramaria rubella]
MEEDDDDFIYGGGASEPPVKLQSTLALEPQLVQPIQALDVSDPLLDNDLPGGPAPNEGDGEANQEEDAEGEEEHGEEEDVGEEDEESDIEIIVDPEEKNKSMAALQRDFRSQAQHSASSFGTPPATTNGTPPPGPRGSFIPNHISHVI